MTTKTSLRLLVPAALTFAAGFATAAAVQEEGLPGPTEHHDLLERMAGEWNAKITAMGSTMEGSYSVDNTLNGMWNLSNMKSELMGMPYQGHGVDGYDPERGKYVSVWVDSMNPSLHVYEGTYDAEADVLTYEGTGKHPMTGEDVPEVHRVTFDGDDEQTFEMELHPEGAEPMTVMTIEYTRRK